MGGGEPQGRERSRDALRRTARRPYGGDVIPPAEERPTLPIWPDLGRALGLGRSATYAAVARGEVPGIITIGHRKVAATRFAAGFAWTRWSRERDRCRTPRDARRGIAESRHPTRRARRLPRRGHLPPVRDGTPAAATVATRPLVPRPSAAAHLWKTEVGEVTSSASSVEPRTEPAISEAFSAFPLSPQTRPWPQIDALPFTD